MDKKVFTGYVGRGTKLNQVMQWRHSGPTTELEAGLTCPDGIYRYKGNKDSWRAWNGYLTDWPPRKVRITVEYVT